MGCISLEYNYELIKQYYRDNYSNNNTHCNIDR